MNARIPIFRERRTARPRSTGSRTASTALATAAAILAVGTLAACSGSPVDPLGFAGCLEGGTGTIAVGVANTSDAALVVGSVELSDASGVVIVDRFIAVDDEARTTAVRFELADREEFGGVDLDQAPIAPDAAAYVGVEVERTGAADGRVGGLVITVDGDEQAVPVTLDLRDSCG